MGYIDQAEMPRILNCCIAHKVWVPPIACKAIVMIPATALPNPLKALGCHRWLIKSCLQGWKAAKAFLVGCHNQGTTGALQNWAFVSMVRITSPHSILRTHRLRAAALAPPPPSTTGSGPRYNNANFVQLSYSGIVKRRSEWNENFAWHFHNCRNPAFIALKPYEFK